MDVSVLRNIYKLWRDDGTTDTTIETELLDRGVECLFPEVVRLIVAHEETPTYWQWRHISRFMAFQLARTPRIFQSYRDLCSSHGIEAGRNDPQLAMVYLAPFLEKWLCGMTWGVCWNRSTLPFLTSDNPVVMWADRGEAAEIGVGFQDRAMEILFPLTPHICLRASQRPGSHEAVCSNTPRNRPQFSDFYPLRVRRAWLGIEQVVKLNQVTVSNAERYVYAYRNQDNVRMFLEDLFLGLPAPVRRFDHKPIGSELDRETSGAL